VQGNGLASAALHGELTNLTGQSHQSDQWCLAFQVFREEKFNSVVMPIHHPLGDIKVLLVV
jgi:hypothetical protein